MLSQKVSPLEQVSCALCGSTAQSLECIAAGHAPTSEGQWRLVRCDDCGLVFLNPRPNQQQIAAFYPRVYYDGSEALMRQRGDSQRLRGLKQRAKRWLAEQHYRARASTAIGRRLRELLLSPWQSRWDALPPVERPGRLLDVGCGTGSYLEIVRDAGWEVVGTEIGDVAIDLCREKGIEVHRGLIEDLPLAPASFDVVHMGQVLEHTHRPRAVLEAACRLLRPGGLLLVDVPNYDAPLRRLFGAQWFAVEAPRHLYHFTPLTLRRLVESCGFTIERLYTKAVAAGAERHLAVTAALSGRPLEPVEGVAEGIALTRHINRLAEHMGCGDTVYVEARRRNAP